MSKLLEIYYELDETLDFLGLSISRSEEGSDKHGDPLITTNERFYVWMGKHLLAYGRFITRKQSTKRLLVKLAEIQKEAKEQEIPYCFLEQEGECFICKTNQIVKDIVFKNDHEEFEKVSDEFEKSIIKVTLSDFQEAYYKTVKDHQESLGEECSKRLFNIKFKKKDVIFTYNCISLSEAKENEVFKALLGGYKGEYLYRYMSAASFYRILNDQKISMCSLNGMNDSTEINYADDYCNIPPFINIYPYPFHFGDEVEYANYDYISSCVSQELADDLTMWRLYGDNGKGVCLKFRIGKAQEGFYLAPVSYAIEPETHPELQFIIDLSSIKFNDSKFGLFRFGVWKHFFKPYEYRTEKEIRLYKNLHDDEAMKWITTQDGIYCPIIEFPIKRKNYQYPLILDSIILGPNVPHKKINKEQIKFRLSKSDIDIEFWNKNVVENSSITCYR